MDVGEVWSCRKQFWFGFVDLKTAFGGDPIEVIRWTMFRLGVGDGWCQR